MAGAFTPGTNAYTVTGSTVNFNGAGAQTIPAFGYNNLTSSSTGARTLASSGTVGVAGTFTPGTNAYTVTGSTVDFNGAGAQTIPAFAYNNLTSSSTRRADAGVERHGRRGRHVHAGHERLHGDGQHRGLQRCGCADDPGVRPTTT